MSSFLPYLMTMGAMFGNQTRYNPLDEIDIDSEYELIKQKKSRLPRSLRDQVIRSYESREKMK